MGNPGEGSPLEFKGALDSLLSSVPDHPLSETRHTFAVNDLRAPSNGLRFWMRALGSPSYAKYIHNLAHPAPQLEHKI